MAVDGSPLAAQLAPALDGASARIEGTGSTVRSAWLTSSTFGGLSWLAHSTLQSGLWVDSQARYDALAGSDRATLATLFGHAGWRTVGVVPANTADWPEGRALYGWDEVLDARSLGYAGPRLGYPTVPDEFTLATLARRELGPGHRPVMAEVDLVTSHAPWTPVPRLVPWDELGDGRVYATAHDDLDPADARAAYGAAIGYSLASVASFVEQVDDPGLVVLVLGDHQPHTSVTGPDPSHDVPVALVTADPDVLARTSAWGWTSGLRPGTSSPTWRMDAVRDRILDAFDDAPTR